MILVADCGGSKYEIGLFDSNGDLIEKKSDKLQLDLQSDFNFMNDLTQLATSFNPSFFVIGIAGISRLTETYLTSFRKKIVMKTTIDEVHIMSDVELLRWMMKEKELGISIGTGSALIYNNESESQTLGGLGFLFNDYLSGWWWFQKFFEVSMLHLEGRSKKLGFEQDFLQLLSLRHDRKSLIKYVYHEPRNVLASHASKMLSEIPNNSWVIKTAEFGASQFLENIEQFDITSVHLQGGMVLHHAVIKNAITDSLREKRISAEVTMTDNLLLGGYRHWLKNQSI